MRFVLDTNAIAEPFRPAPHAGFIRRFRAHATELAIASPTWHEALSGLERMPKGKRKETLRTYLLEVVRPTMTVLPYDDVAAEWHAHERARLGARGRPMSFVDGQIAAIAAVNDLTLVTANLRDFEPYEGLSVVNWAR